MPAQRQRCWDDPRYTNGAQGGISQCRPNGRDVGTRHVEPRNPATRTRNAGPTAEILGPPMRARPSGCRTSARNAGPTAVMLGQYTNMEGDDDLTLSQYQPNGKDVGTTRFSTGNDNTCDSQCRPNGRNVGTSGHRLWTAGGRSLTMPAQRQRCWDLGSTSA